MDEFKIYLYKIILSAHDRSILPMYKGSMLRGSFGHALKRTICISPKKRYCQGCRAESLCAYARTFEPRRLGVSSISLNVDDIPRPFVISCPSEQEVFHKGDELEIDLTLFGEGNIYLPYFIYAFEELALHGLGTKDARFNLKNVISYNPYTKEKGIIYQAGKALFQNSCRPIQYKDLTEFSLIDKSKIHLYFFTPTRIKYKGKFVNILEFHILLRNILRRVTLLCHYYQEIEPNIDYAMLIKEAHAVRTVQDLEVCGLYRYSNRQNARINISGLTGPVSYYGELDKFLPFILLGTHVHVGKGTVFGLGKYKILNPFTPKHT